MTSHLYCTYPAHLRGDSETIVAQVDSVGDGRQPCQHESYERIGRTHHEILGQKEMLRLAVNWEVRLRGNMQREGTLSGSCWRLALGLPINIVIRWRWDYACERGNFHEMRPPLERSFSLPWQRAVGPVCGVDRVSSSVVTSIDGLKLRVHIPTGYHTASGVDSIERSARWLARGYSCWRRTIQIKIRKSWQLAKLLGGPTSFSQGE